MKSVLNRIYSAARYVVVATVCALPVVAQSTAQAETKPVAVVSFAGYSSLMADLDFLGELSGTPQLAQSVEGILAFVTRAQGLAGLDKGKPIGAALMLSDEGAMTPFVFVPVSDSERLLDALQTFVPTVEDLGDGYKQLKLQNGLPIVMKEADGWAYLSSSQDNLEDVPADPAKLLGDLPAKYDLAVQVTVENIPEQYVQIAVQQMRAGAASGLKRLPDEDDDAYRLRTEIVDKYMEQMEQVLQEMNGLTLGVAVDSKTRSSYLDMLVTVKEGSGLAEQIAKAANSATPTKFAGLADPEAVANLHFHTPLMEEDKTVLLEAIEMGRKEATKKIDDEIDDLAARQTVQEIASQVLDVVEATVEEGELDGGAVMVGEGPYQFVVGGLVVDGKKLENAFKQGIELASNEPAFPGVKMNVAEVDGVSFHTLTVPEELDEEAQTIFGEELTIAFGFSDDRLVIAAGEDPIAAAKDVLAKSKTAKKTPPAQLQVKLGPLVELGAESEEDEDKREMAEKIAEILAESGKDHISVTSAFIPNGSRVRIELEEGVLEAFGKAVILGMQRR